MSKIMKDMTIQQVLEIDEDLKDVLMGFGMHCFCCPCALSETLEEAAEVHDVSVELLIEKIEEFLNK